MLEPLDPDRDDIYVRVHHVQRQTCLLRNNHFTSLHPSLYSNKPYQSEHICKVLRHDGHLFVSITQIDTKAAAKGPFHPRTSQIEQ